LSKITIIRKSALRKVRKQEGGLIENAARQLAADIQAGKRTWEKINNTKLDTLATEWGFKTHTTASTVIKRAQAILEAQEPDRLK
jgi:hypothetical protein